jgi:hypothetical protein
LPLIVTLVPPRDVGKSPFQVTVSLARLLPYMDTHSPGWMVAAVLPTGTMPPDVMEGAEEATVSVTGTVIAVDPLLNTTCPAYMPADSVVAVTPTEHTPGVALEYKELPARNSHPVTFNQSPPPAVCAVALK